MTDNSPTLANMSWPSLAGNAPEAPGSLPRRRCILCISEARQFDRIQPISCAPMAAAAIVVQVYPISQKQRGTNVFGASHQMHSPTCPIYQRLAHGILRAGAWEKGSVSSALLNQTVRHTDGQAPRARGVGRIKSGARSINPPRSAAEWSTGSSQPCAIAEPAPCVSAALGLEKRRGASEARVSGSPPSQLLQLGKCQLAPGPSCPSPSPAICMHAARAV